MFTRVEVTNFRAIGPGPLSLPLRPLTVLVGENGTGKSSILQAIALTAQSATEQPRLQDLVVQGSKWSNGEIADIYFRHNPDLLLTVGLWNRVESEWWRRNGLPTASPWRGMSSWPPNQFGYIWSRQGANPTAWSHRFDLDDRRIWDWLGRLKHESHGWDFVQHASVLTESGEFTEPLTPLRTFERVLPEQMFFPPTSVFQRPPLTSQPETTREAVEKAWNDQIFEIASLVAGILRPLSDELRQTFERVFLVEPLRGKELVLPEAGEARSAGRHGQDLLRLLTTLQVRRERPYERFREWAQRFGLKSIESGLQADKLQLSAEDVNGVSVHLTELATGSFQGLLLAAQILLAPHDSVLLVEEPEANMHPAYEKQLASLFAEGLRSGQQLIVTTHSEILVAAVANLIRQRELSADSVALFEVRRGREGVTPTEIPVTDRGLREWVKSFAKVEASLSQEWIDGIPEER